MNRICLLMASTLCSLACSSSSTEEGKAAQGGEPSPSRSDSINLDSRSQYDLASAIREAEMVDPDERSYAFAKVGKDWQGKRYRWEVLYVAPFCPVAARCHIVPFDRREKDRAIVQGWSPRLDITEEEWGKIGKGCPEGATDCTLTFEGSLTEFRISSEELTLLEFTDVAVLSVKRSS